MSRLPSIGSEELDSDQQALWDSVVDSPRARFMKQAPKSLAGPFNPWLYTPGAGLQATQLGEALRFHGTLEQRLKELAICCAGAHWQSEFEFWAHAKLAREAGLSEEVLEAVAAGSSPTFGNATDHLVYQVSQALLKRGGPSKELYESAEEVLGRPALVELVMIVGYYTMVSFTLNTFDVQLPRGVDKRWPDRNDVNGGKH